MIEEYFAAITSQLDILRTVEAENIKKAASACAKSMMNGGVVHIYDTGHMVSSELINRAGGMVGFAAFGFNMTVNSENVRGDREPDNSPDPDLIRLALKRSAIRSGDVLVVGSVSGKTFNPVEVALQASAMGVTVIGLTGVEHSKAIQSEHPSGKRLFEVADMVIDTHVPPGDAMLDVPGMERKICPASGICAAAALWAMTAIICQEMTKAGKPPTTYRSVNLPGGAEDVANTKQMFREKGV